MNVACDIHSLLGQSEPSSNNNNNNPPGAARGMDDIGGQKKEKKHFSIGFQFIPYPIKDGS
jgi:hypothetical protein